MRLWAVARKEVLQLRRDTRSLILAFLLPVLMVVLFGYAISWDVDEITTAVLDRDRSVRSHRLLESFRASGYFRVVRELEGEDEIARLLERGAVRVVLMIPPDFSRELDGGGVARLQALVDGTDANTATIAWATPGASSPSTPAPCAAPTSRPGRRWRSGAASGTTRSSRAAT